MTDPSLSGEPLWHRRLEPVALAATRSAAIACQPWIGRGRPDDADAAATAAMRAALACAPGTGTVVVGEGAKDAAPMLFVGERLGTGDGREFDIAVDPLECTRRCAHGHPGSLAAIAFAPRGTMASLAASFYMEKLVGPAALEHVLDLAEPPLANLRAAADVLGRPPRVVVLDKPRHERLIATLRSAGAELLTPPDGDVAGALQALLPDGEADLLIGIGGTPEGIMTACAARALGGFMQARLAPQRPLERLAVAAAGLDTEHIYGDDELVSGAGLFVATGVTGGTLLAGPRAGDRCVYTDSVVIASGSARRVGTPALAAETGAPA